MSYHDVKHAVGTGTVVLPRVLLQFRSLWMVGGVLHTASQEASRSQRQHHGPACHLAWQQVEDSLVSCPGALGPSFAQFQ